MNAHSVAFTLKFTFCGFHHELVINTGRRDEWNDSGAKRKKWFQVFINVEISNVHY